MQITSLAAPSPVREKAPVDGKKPDATLTDGDKVTLYEDGQLKQEGDNKIKGGAFQRLFLPSGMPESVSTDYVPSRKWAFVRDLTGSVTDYFGTASALNAVGIGSGPLTVGMAWMLRDAIDGVGKVAATTLAKEADRDPKAWTLRGEYAQTAGVLLESTMAIVPGAFLPLACSSQVIKAFGSTAKGAAQKPIDVHQAKGNNHGEVGSKNSAQNMVAGAIGGGLGFGLEALGKATIGSASVPIMAAGFGAVRLFAMHKYVQSLDMDQITEKAVGRVVREWIETGELAHPQGVKIIERKDKDLKKLVMGADLQPFTKDQARFDELRSLYAGRDYLLEVDDKNVCVLLREGSDRKDQFCAVLQAVILQHLRRGDAYEQMLTKEGPEAANRWAVETSLRATPEDPKPLLEQLEHAGWEAKEINFNVKTPRATWDDGPKKELAPLSLEELRLLAK